MKASYSTLRIRFYDGDSLSFRDFILMGDLFEVDPIEVFKLALSDLQNLTSKDMSKKKLKNKRGDC